MTSRRNEVLAALRAAGTAGVPGEGLARDLGVSRAAVGKHVAVLRALGYEVDGSHRGYRLTASPDVPIPEEVASLLAPGRAWDLRGGGVTGSTNDDAKDLARAGAPAGTVVLASRQTGGRGRLGRTWESPEGGVYVSVVLRPAIAAHESAPLAPVAALGVSRGLERLGVRTQVKWPNDVLLDGGKLAGLLVEVSAEADAVEWAVIGVGVNVHPSVPRTEGAAYLADAPGGTSAGLARTAAAVLDGLAAAVGEFESSGFGGLRECYSSRLALLGELVVVRDRQGATVGEGVVRGVDAGARLMLGTADGGETSVTAGEVTLRK